MSDSVIEVVLLNMIATTVNTAKPSTSNTIDGVNSDEPAPMITSNTKVDSRHNTLASMMFWYISLFVLVELEGVIMYASSL